MGDITGPAIAALAIGAVLSVILLVPLIATEYRLWGTLSLGRLFLILAFIPYLISMPLYTLLPLDGDIASLCHASAETMVRLHPFAFVTDIHHEAMRVGWSTTLSSSVFRQAYLNILFFVPLGMFLSRVYRIPRWAVVPVGFAVSLAIELTQLTGNWGLSACQYRYFDVDDLILNTFGAILGIALAPALALIPGTGLRMADRVRPQPVTRKRRLVQLFCDGLILGLILLAERAVASSILRVMGRSASERPVLSILLLATTILLFIVVPLVGGGVTLGERTVLIRVATRQGAPPPLPRVVLKGMAGGGMLGVLGSLAEGGISWAAPVAILLATVAIGWVMVDPQGMTCRASGLRRYDERDRPQPEKATADGEGKNPSRYD